MWRRLLRRLLCICHIIIVNTAKTFAFAFAFVILLVLTLLREVLEKDRNCCYRWWEHIHQPRHWGPGWPSSSPCTAWTERSDSSATLWSVNKNYFHFLVCKYRAKSSIHWTCSAIHKRNYFSKLITENKTNKGPFLTANSLSTLDSAAVSIFVVILVELTNTVFVNSTNITTNIETAVLSTQHPKKWSSSPSFWRKKQPPCEAWQALFTIAAHSVVPV